MNLSTVNFFYIYSFFFFLLNVKAVNLISLLASLRAGLLSC